MGKKRKLKKAMARREVGAGPLLVICGGKTCAPREQTRAVIDEVREYAAHSAVGVEVVKCLHVCAKGPIVATYPKIRFHERVTPGTADVLVDKLVAKAARV